MWMVPTSLHCSVAIHSVYSCVCIQLFLCLSVHYLCHFVSIRQLKYKTVY